MTNFQTGPNWKHFADEKINSSKKLTFMLGRVENIVGKGENAGYQHFLLFHTMFSKGFFLKVIESRNYVVKGYYSRYLLESWNKCWLSREINLGAFLQEFHLVFDFFFFFSHHPTPAAKWGAVVPLKGRKHCWKMSKWWLPIFGQNAFKRLLSLGCLTSDCVFTLSQTTNFGPFQTERVCRQQFLHMMKMAQSYPNR